MKIRKWGMGRIGKLFGSKSDEVNCDDVQELASDYVDEELDEGLLDKVKRHLGFCAPCRSFMENFTKTVRLLRSMPQHRAPESARQRILDETRGQ